MYSTFPLMYDAELTIQDLGMLPSSAREWKNIKQEELKREIARILNIEPEAIIIKMVVEGSVRVVLEMPVRQAETLLSLYRQQDPQLSELIEKTFWAVGTGWGFKSPR